MRSKRVTPSRRESKGQLVLTKLKGQVRVPGQMTSKEEKERWGLGRINLSETKKKSTQSLKLDRNSHSKLLKHA